MQRSARLRTVATILRVVGGLTISFLIFGAAAAMLGNASVREAFVRHPGMTVVRLTVAIALLVWAAQLERRSRLAYFATCGILLVPLLMAAFGRPVDRVTLTVCGAALGILASVWKEFRATHSKA